MDKSLVVFWKSFLVLLHFLVKMQKKKKKTFLKIYVFLSKMFYQIKMQAATNWSSHLKKHQTFQFFKQQIFYAIFKIAFFRDF